MIKEILNLNYEKEDVKLNLNFDKGDPEHLRKVKLMLMILNEAYRDLEDYLKRLIEEDNQK